jgi:hypothetical protein
MASRMHGNVLFENGQSPGTGVPPVGKNKSMGETPMPPSPPNQHEPTKFRGTGEHVTSQSITGIARLERRQGIYPFSEYGWAATLA